MPLQNLAEGLHELRVTAEDAAQNEVQIDAALHGRLDREAAAGRHADDRRPRQGRRPARAAARERGPLEGQATRFYNLRTAAAVKRYQKKHSMPQTGIAGPAVIESTEGHIVVKLHLFQVFVFRDGKRVFYGADRDRHARPRDADRQLRVISKIENPTWVPPNSPWAAGLEPMPPGLSNPLGTRWIGTSAPAIGFHATPMDSSVGHAASHGCMRMHQADVEKMYDLVDGRRDRRDPGLSAVDGSPARRRRRFTYVTQVPERRLHAMSDKILQVTDASFDADVLRSDRPVVVDFWAPWCGPCRRMEPIFDELADAYDSVQFTKMNVDENMATSAKYQILSIPTLLVFKGGEVVKTVVGALPKQSLTSELEPWLGTAVASS